MNSFFKKAKSPLLEVRFISKNERFLANELAFAGGKTYDYLWK
jgi:hypothetical protein